MFDNLDFQFLVKGLEVSFRIIGKVPEKVKFSWDFGDFTDTSDLANPKHIYSERGFYTISLTLKTEDGSSSKTFSKLLVLSDLVKTRLSDSIYNLINNYIPKEIRKKITSEEKTAYINKWQLYIQPLVNRTEGNEIPLEYYNDELFYEGLENQLIVELAAWDFLNIELSNILISTGRYVREVHTEKGPTEGDEEGIRGDRVKKITTGPTEVEYFDVTTEASSSIFSTYIKALQPGGIVEQLKKNLCTLAQRLNIYLPFCDSVNQVVVPKVVNRRDPGILGGPNPTYPLNDTGSVTLIPK